MADLVYIMGTGRSGSTVLQLLLGAAPGAFAAGELTHLHQDGYVRVVDCSCGNPASRCPVWGEVRRRYPSVDFSRAEWHTGVPRMLLGPLPQGYADHQRALVDTIKGVTGAEVVVDSSKFVARGVGLSRALGGRVKVVMLTRSPEGLLKSFARRNEGEQPPKTPRQVERYHAAVLAMMRAAAGRVDAIELTYEDLVRDPVETLARLGDHTGLELGGVAERVAAGDRFEVGHLLTGNRLRRDGPVVFRPDLPEPGLVGGRRVRRMRKTRRLLGFKDV